MYFNFTNKYNYKTILCFSILIFLTNTVSALDKDDSLIFQEKTVKELIFKVSDIETALCKNEMAKITIYLSWVTYIFFFITANKEITFKNLMMSFIAGGWLGASLSWHKYLALDDIKLKEKNNYFKNALEIAQLRLEQLNIEHESINETIKVAV